MACPTNVTLEVEVNPNRSWQVLRKDLRLGPRSPLVLWALVLPIALTLLVRGVFGDLFADEPRLGLVDQGSSAVTAAALDLDGVEVRLLDDPAALEAEVRDGRLDAGLVLPAGFDEAVVGGDRPALPLWLSGESLPSDRALLTVSLLGVVRDVSGAEATVAVEVVEVGEAGLPIDLRLLPLLVLYAVAIPGGMVPAASLVEEKEHGTLHAVLTTPTSIGEVLAAKGALGVLLGVVAGLMTLAMNDAFGPAPLAVLLAVVLGAVMMAELGLILGAWARDTNTLFAAWKAAGLVVFLPAIFFLWPDLPAWPAYLMPAYYFLQPAYAVGVEGAGLADVAAELAIGLGICVLMVPVVIAAGRRLQVRLVAGPAGPSRSTATDEALPIA
jgi:ABC-2 type transport system permease protein